MISFKSLCLSSDLAKSTILQTRKFFVNCHLTVRVESAFVVFFSKICLKFGPIYYQLRSSPILNACSNTILNTYVLDSGKSR